MFVLSGENSMLARYILPVFRESSQVFAFNQDKGNIEDAGFVSACIDEIKPKIFINCEGLDQPEECEYNREYAYRLNGRVPAAIGHMCRERDILLVHFSTSYIFSGVKRTPCAEDDLADPCSVFGDSKLLGEKGIMDSGCRYLILRLPEVYGEGPNFLSRAFESIRNTGGMHVIKNQFISTIYAKDAALVLRDLLDSGAEGVYHLANESFAAAGEFIKLSLELYKQYSGKDIGYSVNELDYDELVTPVERPLYGVLDTAKCAGVLGKKMRNWQDAVDEFISRFHMNF